MLMKYCRELHHKFKSKSIEKSGIHFQMDEWCPKPDNSTRARVIN